MGNSGELRKVLNALKILNINMSKVIDGSISVDIDAILDIEEEDTTTLMSSVVVSILVTENIESQSISTTNLVILSDAYTINEGYIDTINPTELYNMIKSINAIIPAESSFESINGSILGQTLQDDSKLDVVLGSIIVEATITMKLYDSLNTLDKPSTLVINSEYENINNWMGNSGELRKLIASFKELGILDNIETPVTTFELGTLPSEKDKLETIFTSEIVRLNVSSSIVDSGLEIHETAKDENNVVTKDELVNLVISLKTLGITSFNSIDISLSALNKTDEQLNTILTSIIARNKVSNSVMTSSLVIPANIVDTNGIITSSELVSLIKALNEVGVEGFSSITIQLSDILTGDKDVLLESTIMQVKVSALIKADSTFIAAYNNSYDTNFKDDVDAVDTIDTSVYIEATALIYWDNLGVKEVLNIYTDFINNYPFI